MRRSFSLYQGKGQLFAIKPQTAKQQDGSQQQDPSLDWQDKGADGHHAENQHHKTQLPKIFALGTRLFSLIFFWFVPIHTITFF